MIDALAYLAAFAFLLAALAYYADFLEADCEDRRNRYEA